MSTDVKVPMEEGFGPFLSAFMKRNDLNAEELALGFECSIYTIERLAKGETHPTERAHAELVTALLLIEGGKGKDAYLKMNKEDRRKIVDKVIAGGGSALTIGAALLLVQSLGVAGLSAAGITSGLAAIGAMVGGGMLAGILAIAVAPLAVGAAIYYLMRSGSSDKPNTLFQFRYTLDPTFEVKK